MSPKERTSKKDESCMPVHSPRGEDLAGDGLRSWKEKYGIADTKLLKLEEELDVLLHYARTIREERTDLLQNRLTYSDPLRNDATLEDGHNIIDKYLALVDRSKALEETIMTLKEECASSRSYCNYCAKKIRALSSNSKRFKLFGRISLHSQESLPYGGAESGFTDPLSIAERIIEAENTATNVSAVVAALGASIAYTTLFSASRGRLDLISWAFACFIFVVMSCAAFQVFAPPQHGQIARILRMEYVGSAEHRLLSFIVLVGLPMVGGFIFLALSVAFLDSNAQSAITGSQLAIRAAGYLPTAFLGYFVLAMIIFALAVMAIRLLTWYNLLEWPMEHLPPDARKHYPSILFGVKDKLVFLPGGEGYTMYRNKRLSRAKEF